MPFQVEQQLPAGTVGVIADHVARYTDFSISISALNVPRGSAISWAVSADIAGNCNDLSQNFKGEWLWIMGDDHVFHPDMLISLLKHDVDIVVPICARKYPPFHPVVYSDFVEDGGYATIDLSKHPDGGLVEIEAAGSAGMLVKRHVFDALEAPHFRYHGERGGTKLSEDLYFCYNARQAGFKIYCDLDQSLGHIRPVNLMVTRDQQHGWGRTLDFGTGDSIFVPEAAMGSVT